VEVGDVRLQAIQEVWRLTGAIQPASRYVVSPRVAGRVLTISKRIGDRVAEGEVIARLDDSEYQQAVLEAEAALRISQATVNETRIELALAAQNLERMQALEAKQYVSRMDLDKARAEHDGLASRVKLSEAQVEQREAALETARIKLGYAILTAPQPGFVSERFVDEGGTVAANGAVLSVIGINPAVVRTTVTESLYGRIKVGQNAEVEVDAYPGKGFPGGVSRIAPQFDDESRTASMEIEVANPSLLLKPGMFANVRIVLAEKRDAQVVPTAAIVSRDGSSGVFVVEGAGIARYVSVKAGIATAEVTEILSPTLTGKVVTLGQHLLEDGSQVILPGAGGTGGGRGTPSGAGPRGGA
jgi:RND family efflux transporter MFP subunit